MRACDAIVTCGVAHCGDVMSANESAECKRGCNCFVFCMRVHEQSYVFTVLVWFRLSSVVRITVPDCSAAYLRQ